jgi:hypothetical protein
VILRTKDEMERSNVRIRVEPPQPRPKVTQQAAARLGPDTWPILIYTISRFAIYLVAGLDVLITHRPFAAELSLYDGQWYMKLAAHGYPAHALHAKSTLGFLPLYPLVIAGLAYPFSFSSSPLLVAALTTSFAGGLITAILIRRLATVWWGEQTARRATLVFCLFPGSIVFSLAYSECLTLPLVLGCLFALREGRWAWAGVLAGLATAVEPAAVILIPVCVAVSWRQGALHGWRDRRARRSLLAPLLAPSGIATFAVYLWYRTGTPFASYEAQHYGWHQGDPFALLSQPIARRLLAHPSTLPGHLLNLSLWNGLLGSVFLMFALVALARARYELTPGVLLWAAGVGALTLWSVMSLTNARMLLIAFPAVLIWARRLSGRRFTVFLGAEVGLFVIASGLTLGGLMLP